MSKEQKEAQFTLQLIKGVIKGFPEEQQRSIEILSGNIRKIVETSDLFGPIALALIGAEYAAKGE